MSNPISRRALLATLPATGAALAFPASASADDPTLTLYHDYLKADRDWHIASELPGNGNYDFPESLDAESRKFRAIDRMAETTPSSMAGLAALVHVFWREYGPVGTCGSELYDFEIDRSENRLLASLWRGASGESGVPSRPE